MRVSYGSLVSGLFVAVVGLSMAMPGETQAQDGWTPALQMQYKAVQGTEISPDGQHVAFMVREPIMEGEKSEYLSHIWIADADGSGARQFTRGDKSVGSPSFSPDGNHLAFTSGRSGEVVRPGR
jgi:Tol biopolymer transport system component